MKTRIGPVSDERHLQVYWRFNTACLYTFIYGKNDIHNIKKEKKEDLWNQYIFVARK